MSRDADFMPSQLNMDAPYRAEPIDIWGIGVILFTLLAGSRGTFSHPMDSLSLSALKYFFYQILHGTNPLLIAPSILVIYPEKSSAKIHGIA